MAATKGMTSLKTVGKNEDNLNIGLSSNSKASINPTSDSDDGNPRAKGLSEMYGMSNAGGASGDKDVGYPGTGAGISQLDNAHGNDAKRNLNYGN